jgi:FkbM family methyltransferase
MLLDFDNLYTKYGMNVTGVIHIGAHFGQEYKTYKKYPTIENIIFFEPDPDSFAKLKETVGDDESVVCINKALGPFSCKAQMNKETANEGQSNSILEPGIHLQQYPNITFDDTYEVSVEPLDKFQPNSTLNMINIDVQGFELNVFLGARRTLHNVDYIYAEINRQEVYKGCPHVDDLDYFLGKHQFVRIETDWAGQTWGDALYIKSQ